MFEKNWFQTPAAAGSFLLQQRRIAMSVATGPGVGQTLEVQQISGREQLCREFQHLRSQWWWLMLFGILLVVCGTAAIVFPAVTLEMSLLATVAVGAALMVGGIATIITTIWSGRWSGMLVSMLVGLLYVLLGYTILERPFESTIMLTIFVAMFFIVVGLFRTVAALTIRFPYWGWAMLNGLVTSLFGLIVFRGLKEMPFLVAGLLIGVEMLFHGWTWIALSLAIRRIPADAA
jgi:uncharacterized membrane protein HdeD (DUF308 family)